MASDDERVRALGDRAIAVLWRLRGVTSARFERAEDRAAAESLVADGFATTCRVAQDPREHHRITDEGREALELLRKARREPERQDDLRAALGEVHVLRCQIVRVLDEHAPEGRPGLANTFRANGNGWLDTLASVEARLRRLWVGCGEETP